jgi:lysozyme family protein
MHSSREVFNALLESEGGFVNHPDDGGGPTNFGITQATLSHWRREASTLDDVKTLSRDEALTIYSEQYFLKTKIDQLPLRIQSVVLDDAVLSGPVTAIKTLQRHLRHASVDGIIGPQTCSIAAQQPTAELITNLVRSRVERYCRIVQRDATQSVFLVGWVRRAMRFL